MRPIYGVPVASGTEWEDEALRWVRWARAAGHDAYWSYRRSFFEAIVPPPGRLTVELGCGEGRVLRDLRERHHRVIGIDLSPTLLRHAREADPGAGYVLADASTVPLAGGSCDVVVAYNSLMDIDDMPGAVAEASRVLAPGGHFCVCLTHPAFDAGRFDGPQPDAVFSVTRPYFGRRRFEETVDRDGLTMAFRGWTYPLEAYARSLEQAGLLIEIIREPVPDTPPPHLVQWNRLPLFLHLRALKPRHGGGHGDPVATVPPAAPIRRPLSLRGSRSKSGAGPQP